MSRSGYSEDCDNLDLYRGTVERSIAGKRGQAFLRKLKEALEALPEKRLEESVLVSPSGCCAMGAVALHQGIDVSHVDPEDRDAVALVFNISPSVASEIAFENDGGFEGRHETPENRYSYMLTWARRKLGELK